jgi:hypothetical protein
MLSKSGLCSHPVADDFARCAEANGSIDNQFQCEELATSSVTLTSDTPFFEYVRTAMAYDVATDAFEVIGVFALSPGAADCSPTPIAELRHLVPRATQDTTWIPATLVTAITLEAFEEAKWEAVLHHENSLEVPGVGAIDGFYEAFSRGWNPALRVPLSVQADGAEPVPVYLDLGSCEWSP